MDDREVEYYRNKAKDEEVSVRLYQRLAMLTSWKFIYMACKFWETTGYLDSSGLSTLYRAIRLQGILKTS